MKHTSEACFRQLPDILIDYLWQVVSPYRTNNLIVLSPRVLGAGAVQDITVFSGNTILSRTVFGFTPVTAAVEVNYDGENYTMSPTDNKGKNDQSHKEDSTCPH